MNEEISEQLIEGLRRRPCLWDNSLPYEERGPNKKQLAWDTIAKVEFNGKFCIEHFKQRWKDLKDQYIKKRSKRTKKRGTGQSRQESQDDEDIEEEELGIGKFPFYAQMDSFLANANKTNIEPISSITPQQKQLSTVATVSKTGTKEKTNSMLDELLVSCLSQQGEKEPDEMDAWLNYVRSILKKLPESIREDLQIQFVAKCLQALNGQKRNQE